MFTYVPARIKNALQIVGELSTELRTNAFVAGGFVRDLLLDRDSEDLDIVIEGDAMAFATAVHKKYGGKLILHKDFGTATLSLSPSSSSPPSDSSSSSSSTTSSSSSPPLAAVELDFATSRRETYPHPGSLPVVEPGPILADLYRRDITINSMAIRLSTDRFGELVDLEGGLSGRQDLEDRLIRILHPLSFRDDPTRMFRAVRFEQRLGWQLETETEERLREAVQQNFISTISGVRIHNELVKIANEQAFVGIFERLVELGIWSEVFPTPWTDEQETLKQVDKVLRFYATLDEAEQPIRWKVVLGGLLVRMPKEQFNLLMTKLHLNYNTGYVDEIQTAAASVPTILALLESNDSASGNHLRLSTLYRALKPFPLQTVLIFLTFLQSKDEHKQFFRRYLTDLRHRKYSVTGAQLRAHGIPSGPLLGQLLNKIFDAELDGEIPVSMSPQYKIDRILHE